MDFSRFRVAFDSVLNTVTGLGGGADKGTTVLVDTSRVSMPQPDRDSLARFDGYVASWFDRTADEAQMAGWVLRDRDTDESASRLVEAEERRLGLRSTIGCASWSAMRDGGALVFLVTGESDLKKPFKLGTKILAMHHFDASEFRPLTWDDDIRSTNFRGVKLWSITPGVSTTPSNDRDGRRRNAAKELDALSNGVHYTRVLYIPGRILTPRERHENGGLDASYLDSAWDALKDQRQVDQGGAVLAQEMKESVLKIANLANMEQGQMAQALLDRITTLAQGKGVLGTVVIAEGDEYTTKATSASGFKDLKGAAKATWAAATKQPETVAYGATPGGLNTDGEAGRKSWDRVLDSDRKKRLRSPLEKFYTYLLASLEGKKPERWEVSFNDLGTLTLSERAALMNNIALTDKVNITAGVYSAEFVRRNRYGAEGFRLELPPVPPEEAASVPGNSLSGPQLRGVIETLTQVAKGGMSRAAGIQTLRFALNLPEGAAEEIVADHGETFTVDPEDVTATPDLSPDTSQDQPGATE